jgi:hypothetical protein
LRKSGKELGAISLAPRFNTNNIRKNRQGES